MIRTGLIFVIVVSMSTTPCLGGQETSPGELLRLSKDVSKGVSELKEVMAAEAAHEGQLPEINKLENLQDNPEAQATLRSQYLRDVASFTTQRLSLLENKEKVLINVLPKLRELNQKQREFVSGGRPLQEVKKGLDDMLRQCALLSLQIPGLAEEMVFEELGGFAEELASSEDQGRLLDDLIAALDRELALCTFQVRTIQQRDVPLIIGATVSEQVGLVSDELSRVQDQYQGSGISKRPNLLKGLASFKRRGFSDKRKVGGGNTSAITRYLEKEE